MLILEISTILGHLFEPCIQLRDFGLVALRSCFQFSGQSFDFRLELRYFVNGTIILCSRDVALGASFVHDCFFDWIDAEVGDISV